MKKETFCEMLSDIDEEFVREARAESRGKKPGWLRWGALAAFLCVLLAIPALLFRPAEAPNDAEPSGDGPAGLTVDGSRFVISPRLAVSDELPEGFLLAGEADVEGVGTCPYYVNPDMPEWVYVYQEVRTDGAVDSTGTLTSTEPHNAYARYVDSRIRGKDLVFCNGSYFISMWSAQYWGDGPDVGEAFYESVESAYGVRLEGEVPEGFVSAGTAEFSGYDTLPRGGLSSNQGEHEVYVNPGEPDVVLVPTCWYTAAAGEPGETKHEGFDVYLRCDCPLP